MGKICVRCGYERQEGDQAPDTECPRCGVIYAKAEGAAENQAHHGSQMRIVRANAHQRRAKREGGHKFTAFRTMYTPMLVRVAFLFCVVFGIAGAILAVMQEQFLVAVLSVVSIVAARLALEGIAVVFKLADDVAAVRELLVEQELAEARRDSQIR